MNALGIVFMSLVGAVLSVMLMLGALRLAYSLPAIDATKLIAVVLVFATGFGVLLVLGAPSIAALCVGGFACAVAAALMAGRTLT